MHNYFNTVADCLVYSDTVTDISFNELEIFILKTGFNVSAFDLGVVKVVEIINADDRPTFCKKSFA